MKRLTRAVLTGVIVWAVGSTAAAQMGGIDWEAGRQEWKVQSKNPYLFDLVGCQMTASQIQALTESANHVQSDFGLKLEFTGLQNHCGSQHYFVIDSTSGEILTNIVLDSVASTAPADLQAQINDLVNVKIETPAGQLTGIDALRIFQQANAAWTFDNEMLEAEYGLYTFAVDPKLAPTQVLVATNACPTTNVSPLSTEKDVLTVGLRSKIAGRSSYDFSELYQHGQILKAFLANPGLKKRYVEKVKANSQACPEKAEFKDDNKDFWAQIQERLKMTLEFQSDF